MSNHILSVVGLIKYFEFKEGLTSRSVKKVRAVDGVNFRILKGESVGLVGESGCGKTTVGKCVLGLLKPTEGFILFDTPSKIVEKASVMNDVSSFRGDDQLITLLQSHSVQGKNKKDMKRLRRRMQVINQDPYASLDPRFSVKDIVGEPLVIHDVCKGRELSKRVLRLIERVGLQKEHLLRFPHELSGGQRQRIVVARALTLNPELLVLDEPTSALDVSVQSQVLNLLLELQREQGLTYLMISHDLKVIRYMCDRVFVMYLGVIVEEGPTEQIFSKPLHPYTKALISALPSLNSEDKKNLVLLRGEVPKTVDPPLGCRFHPRCPVATNECGWDAKDLQKMLEESVLAELKKIGVVRMLPEAFTLKLRFKNGTSTSNISKLIQNILRDNVRNTLVTQNILKITSQKKEVTITMTGKPQPPIIDIGDRRRVQCVLYSQKRD